MEAGGRTAVCSDRVLQTSLGYMNRSRNVPLHALSTSLGTEDCRVQMKGDPEASPGHEERPVNLFRWMILPAVHSNQNTHKHRCGRTNVASEAR